MNATEPLTGSTPGPAVEGQNQPSKPQTCTVDEVTSNSQFQQRISDLPPSCCVVVYFYAPWAEPCKQMATILSTLASTYAATSPPEIAFISLDAEEVVDVCEEYDVKAIPLVIVQKDKKVLEKIDGIDASKLRNAVEKHAGRPGVGDPGKVGLPPAQNTTPRPAPATAEDEAAPHINGSSNGSSNGDLSKYAPSSSDPSTAPEYSSGETNGSSEEDLHARLDELVKAADVMLFMKGTPKNPRCGFSKKAVGILREKGLPYGFFDIMQDADVKEGLKAYKNWPTYPQFYIGGELLGGLDVVEEELRQDPSYLKSLHKAVVDKREEEEKKKREGLEHRVNGSLETSTAQVQVA